MRQTRTSTEKGSFQTFQSFQPFNRYAPFKTFQTFQASRQFKVQRFTVQ
jgi:hypothetical protein